MATRPDRSRRRIGLERRRRRILRGFGLDGTIAEVYYLIAYWPPAVHLLLWDLLAWPVDRSGLDIYGMIGETKRLLTWSLCCCDNNDC